MSALAAVHARFRRRWRVLRVAGAALAALGLLSVAVFGGELPVGAQEAGAEIRIRDLSDYPTHLTVDSFTVELTNLTATAEYQVIVSSDSANLGIGACGTASQTATVTEVAAEDLKFLVYACAVGGATVTAEVRRAGASSSEASIRQTLTVEAVPDVVIEASGKTRRTTRGAGAVARAGTPGGVPSVSLSMTGNSITASWGTPSDGGQSLTGFGVLFWRAGYTRPPYSSAQVVGPSARSRTYSGRQSGSGYHFGIHACNGTDSCGYWKFKFGEIPPVPPPAPSNFRETGDTQTSVTLGWS